METALNFLTPQVSDPNEWFSKYHSLFYYHYYAAYEHSISIS